MDPAPEALIWDGERRLGPVALGMSLDDVAASLPGTMHRAQDDGEDEPIVYFAVDSLGLSVGTLQGIVVLITSRRSFVSERQNLIGMPIEAALALAGDAVRSDFGSPIESVFTTRSLELDVEDGRVLWVTLWTSDDEVEALATRR